MADRVEYVLRTTEVKHISKPYGSGRDSNPPHLWDLRKFVEACEGLSNSLVVTITTGNSDNVGRREVMLSVKQVEPVTDAMVEERASKLDWFKRTKEEDPNA